MPYLQHLSKRQGALTGVTSGASDAGRKGYNSVKDATSSLSTGQIAGAIVAIVVGFGLICFMLWYLCTRRLRQRSRLNASEHGSDRPMMTRSPAGAAGPGGRSTPLQPYGFTGFGGGNDNRQVRYSKRPANGAAAGGAIRGRDYDAGSDLSQSTEALTSPQPIRSDSRLDALDGGKTGGWRNPSPTAGGAKAGRASRSYAQI
ncbi:hypothetical protein BDZ90DRAFT_230355 [Jaminaea rosea]|uniref:Uncharacterized protein n=1 Tax=Jaminaea rosea TaxID=1569628 RepID=A0A316UZY6_9BASI|nr:hypothetical protein BDZ90DRAFT_230355 [Jaminaea rosea]PWN29483.1 hypothetical protein BDZ90DRAFT_230355 [Jaminaea rosea]